MPKLVLSIAVILGAVLGIVIFASCGSGTQTAVDASATEQKGPRERSAEARQRPQRAEPEPVAFTGNFSTEDTRHRCKAGNRVVVCASTVSGQRVTLDESGARYEGEVATSFPAAAPLGVGNEITTFSGIRCINSSRGIECTRGGHGFVIGDSAIVILKGPSEERFEATAPEPEPEVPAYPEPADDLTADGEGSSTQGQVCWPGVTIPETTIPAVHIPAQTIPATTIGGVHYPEQTLPPVDLPAQVLPGRTLPPSCFDAGAYLGPADTSVLVDGFEGIDPDFSRELSEQYWNTLPSLPEYVAPGFSAASIPDTSAAGYGELNEAGFPRNQYVSSYVRKDGVVVDGYWRNSSSDGLPTCRVVSC